MKKSAIAIAVLIASLSFVSCKKEYTCTCRDTTTGDETSVTLQTRNKPLAKTACNNLQLSGEECTLK